MNQPLSSTLHTAWLLPLLAAVGCREAAPPARPSPLPPPSATASDAPSGPSGTASAASTAEAPAAPGGTELANLLCGDATGTCAIRRERAAGVDGAGRSLAVVSVHRGIDYLGGQRAPDPADASPALLGIEETASSDILTPALGWGACQRFDYWLVTRDAVHPPERRLLLETCNDGRGSAGLGEDRLTVDDGALTFESGGGSSWRWGITRELALSPLRLVSLADDGSWSLGHNRAHSDWSFDTFSGRTSWYSPPCGADGTPPDVDAVPDADPDDEFSFVAIPSVELVGDFVASGWKSAALGRCAAHVDATGEGGFVTRGAAGAASDASLRVVASRDGVLFVEVHDDHWLGPSGDPAKDDHLELWLAEKLPTYMDHCLDAASPIAAWGIRIADGEVFAAAGKPVATAAITVVRVATATGPARFAITLPKGYAAVSLAYADGDDARGPERTIATSRLVAGVRASLGALRAVEPSRAVCRVEDGALEPVLEPYRGDEPILSAD